MLEIIVWITPVEFVTYHVVNPCSNKRLSANWGTPRKKNEPKENKKEIGFKLGEKIFW